MHLHGHHAVVLARNGVDGHRQPVVDRLARTSTTRRPYDIAFVADNPGIWMDHCHNLQHAAQGLVDAPDVRRRHHPVQVGIGLRQHPGVTLRPPAEFEAVTHPHHDTIGVHNG